MICSGIARYEITDGTTTVNLLANVHGFHVKNYVPGIASPKNDGVWSNSPSVEGRRLIDRVYGNVVDEITLSITDYDMDDIILHTRNLRMLLEKSTNYWKTRFSSSPVWIRRRGANESSMTYAIIYDWRAVGDANPFSIPFFSVYPAIPEFTLMLEHGIWEDTEYGNYQQLGITTVKNAYDSNGSPRTLPIASMAQVYDDGYGNISSIFQHSVDAAQTHKFVLSRSKRGQKHVWYFSILRTAQQSDSIYSVMWPIFSYWAGSGNVHGTRLTVLDLLLPSSWSNLRTGVGGVQYTDAEMLEVLLKAPLGPSVSRYNEDIMVSGLSVLHIVPDGAELMNWISSKYELKDNILYGISFKLEIESANVEGEDIQWIQVYDYDSSGIEYASAFGENVVGGLYSTLYGEEVEKLSIDNMITNKNVNVEPDVVSYYDASSATYTTIQSSDSAGVMQFAKPPQSLFPNPMGVGDFVMFIFEASDARFAANNIVLTLESVNSEAITEYVWEYLDLSDVWQELQVVQDNFKFLDENANIRYMNDGVNVVVFSKPANWSYTGYAIGTGPGGYNKGYIIRMRILAVSGSYAPPTLIANAYSAVNAAIQISGDDVNSDLPLPFKLILHNSFETQLNESDVCGIFSPNVVMLGLRSESRGLNFSAYLSFDMTVLLAPYFGVMDYTINDTSINPLITLENGDQNISELRVQIENTVSGSYNLTEIFQYMLSPSTYTGKFRVYVRYYYTDGLEPVDGRVYTMRLGYGIHENNLMYTEEVNLFEKHYHTNATEKCNLLVADMGIIELNLDATVLDGGGAAYVLKLYIGNSSDELTTINITDFILMPVDEFSAIVSAPHIETGDIKLGAYQMLEIGSLDDPREQISAKLKSNNDIVIAKWNVNSTSKALLQPNTDQKLWVFSMFQNIANDNIFADQAILLNVTMYKSGRYFNMKGA